MSKQSKKDKKPNQDVSTKTGNTDGDNPNPPKDKDKRPY